MLQQDLIIIDGKRYIQTVSGKKYQLGKRLGQGGQAKTFLLRDDKKQKYVLKEYPVPKDQMMRDTQRAVKRNLAALIKQPIKLSDGKPLESMVPPIDLVMFDKTGSMGYVMNYVPIVEENYLSIKALLKTAYPDTDVLSEIGWQISHFFHALAGSGGVCYKDINEGNIYLNPKTGAVRVIDNDNVGDPSTRTISGTTGYMAPEVVMNLNDPDKHTDRFQLATYLFRLFVGAYPYEGSRAVRYMIDNEMSMEEAAPEVFGKNAVFIFDPRNTSNTIRVKKLGSMSAQEQDTVRTWNAQAIQWDRLPEIMKEKFITTFTKTTVQERQQRVTPLQWQKVFEKLKETNITCPECKRKTFGLSRECFYCGSTKRKMITCKSCGEQTPQELPLCIHCEKDPRSAPKKTIACPHCKKTNPEDADRCSSCRGFIRVSCMKCRKVYPGNTKVCPRCKISLYSSCPKCGKDNPVDARACGWCNEVFSRQTRQCVRCGRNNMGWFSKCIECGTPLGNSVPGVPGGTGPELKTFLFQVRAAEQTHNAAIALEIGGAKEIIVYADQLVGSLPHVPLFRVRRNRKTGAYGLQNKTGGTVKYKVIATSAAAGIQPDQVHEMTPDYVFTFDNCVVQGKAIQIRLRSVT